MRLLCFDDIIYCPWRGKCIWSDTFETRHLVGYMSVFQVWTFFIFYLFNSYLSNTFHICNLFFLCNVGYASISHPCVIAWSWSYQWWNTHATKWRAIHSHLDGLQDYKQRIDAPTVDDVICTPYAYHEVHQEFDNTTFFSGYLQRESFVARYLLGKCLHQFDYVRSQGRLRSRAKIPTAQGLTFIRASIF